MSAEQGLLSDICESPEDDTPRLVYADWLEENDTPQRAEFIRVQCELSRLPAEDAHRPGLVRREAQLLAAHEGEWLGPLAKMISSPRFRRGFLEQVSIGVRQFMDNGDEIFRLAPVCHLKLLRLTQTKIPLREVANCPHLARLRGLDINGSQLGDPGVEKLLSSPHLKNLEVLRLGDSMAGSDTLRALLKGDLPRLKVLDLHGNDLNHALRVLKKAPSFQLQSLNLNDTGIRAAEIGHLLRWEGLAGLRELSLRNNYLGVAGGEALAKSKHLEALTTLDLGGCSIGGRGMQALAGTEALPNLTTLDLGNNNIGRIGTKALTESPYLGKVRGLLLEGNNLQDYGVRLLADWPGLVHHTRLWLGNNGITDEAVLALVQSPHLGPVTELSLSTSAISDEGARALASCPRLASLTHLYLVGCNFRNKGAQALLDSLHLQGLQVLGLFEHSFSPAIRAACRKRFGASEAEAPHV
jgi:uncharacterized protein (TIGR02996 family)